MTNSLITLAKSNLTRANSNEVDVATDKPLVEKKINYQLLYKQVESAIEEILLEYPNDPVVEKLKVKVINNLKPLINQIVGE
jgi:hypothetical protein|tara:strand:+ start:2047 stop:2292 length:246 start_codon:yes stop_codon:yes gene_type:complete